MLVEKNLSCAEIFPYDRLSCGEVSPHEKCGAKCVMWRNLSCGEMFSHDRFLHMSIEQCNLFVATDVVLLQTLFCCNLRCFVAKSILS